MTEKLGATGKFPEGKLHPGDEGELNLGVARDAHGNVHLNFGKEIAWVAMPPEVAINLARALLKHAGVKRVDLTM